MTAAELRQWRTGLGLTQLEASQRLGLSLRQYARLEAGGRIRGPVALLVERMMQEGLPC